MSKILIALGGNALGNSPSEQKKVVKTTAKVIVDLYQKKHKIVIVHGNGPQVGWINNAFMHSFKKGISKEFLPFPECGAMSQGYIGYHIQNAILNELHHRGHQGGQVISLVSQTIVDNNDPAFQNPTKPIGDFMIEQEAKKLAHINGWIVKEDAGRGWRRVIASPKPVAIPSIEIVNNLVDNNVITIVGGGGGIPVVDGKKITGVDAVIDKDATAAYIAQKINADRLVILTAVDFIKINFGKSNEELLNEVSIDRLNSLIKENHFAPGSMLPKIRAAIEFVEKTGQVSYIGELKNATKILSEQSGTKIYK